ncbi:MAG: SURF1 family protein [Chromatiales bacterium]
MSPTDAVSHKDRRLAWMGGLLVLALGAVFVRLGFWQLDRAAQKRAEHAHYQSQRQLSPAPLTDLLQLPAEKLRWRAVTASGSYLPAQDIVLDNQSYHRQPGYLVYTPFALRDMPGIAVLVSRGWIPLSDRREEVAIQPVVTDERTLHAVVGRPPPRGVPLRGGERIERLAGRVRRVQAINYAALAAELGVALKPYVLLLDPQAPDGFVRDWATPGNDAIRHQSYAVQWFAMATALAVIYAVLWLRSRR